MVQQMGLQSTHDHALMKGMPANSMNMTHEQCQHVLQKTPTR
jgi:hypothetical protein